MARAEKYTALKVTPIYYSDFLTNFDRNPLSGALGANTNDEAIKESLKNLILTNRGERPYKSRIGSKIYSALFEPFSPSTVSLMEELIKECIKHNEPRVKVLDVRINDDLDRNGIYVTIVFSIINIPTPTSLNLFISRVR